MSLAPRDRVNPLEQPPFVLSWDQDSPLPLGEVRPTSTRAAGVLRQSLTCGGLPGLPPPDWLATGPIDRPFDFCGHIRALCRAITQRCPELRHIDVNRVLFGYTQARNGRSHGLQARVTPLRFRGGQLTRRQRGTYYRVQRFRVDGYEILYVMTFCLPRFLDQEFDEKFVTLFHELYHLGPAFDGDLRRHPGRYTVHSHSQREYDGQMADLARAYLTSGADPALHAFLRLNFAQLVQRHGKVIAVKPPRAKMIPIPAP